ncbi:hypothetical protein B0H16DRAFT_1528562 [Mycena metata]|uniref:Leucine rich repeat domain containing protein n=1 Tax=Mycena metata TaxID=1033252 RepID=A0AAD7JHY8_9AGAR|nr:hypothetical protein B0H16DRAFT_1528562 [Mycena metata]
MGLGSFLRSSSSAANISAQPGPSNVGEYGGKDVSSGKDGGNGGGKATDESTRILKRAHFILPEIAVVYPISSAAPPSTPTLREEKRAIEEKERERRRRVVWSNSYGYMGAGGSTGGDAASTRTSGSRDTDAGGEESTWWPMDKVESFYRECCEGCQEVPDKGICTAFKVQPPPNHPRTVSFSGVQLTPASAAILADVLSIEWGLRKVVWRECDLEEATLKPLLHALLIPRSLSFLSLASNKKLKGNAWRVLARAVRTSTLRNISLRHNKISPTGAVALALMIRDYPDVLAAPTATSPSSTFLTNSYSHSSVPPSPTIAAHHLDHLREHHHSQAYNGGGGGGSGNASPILPTGPNSGIGLGLGGLSVLNSSLAHAQLQIQAQKPPPPPHHPAQTITAAQTTYTPYVPRRRQQSANAGAGAGAGVGAAPPGRAVVASSVLGGVTARHVPSPPASSPASSVYGGVHGMARGIRSGRRGRRGRGRREGKGSGMGRARRFWIRCGR